MAEYQIGWTTSLAMLGLVLTCTLWWLGGRSNKWLRRYLGAATVSSTVNGCAWIMGIWNPWLLGLFGTTAIGFSMGYGGDSLTEKRWRRLLFALGNVASGLYICLCLGGSAWILLPLHLAVGCLTVCFAQWNPLHAASEEALVCALLNLYLVMYPFVRL